jgi:hypothetical protein
MIRAGTMLNILPALVFFVVFSGRLFPGFLLGNLLFCDLLGDLLLSYFLLGCAFSTRHSELLKSDTSTTAQALMPTAQLSVLLSAIPPDSLHKSPKMCGAGSHEIVTYPVRRQHRLAKKNDSIKKILGLTSCNPATGTGLAAIDERFGDLS